MSIARWRYAARVRHLDQVTRLIKISPAVLLIAAPLVRKLENPRAVAERAYQGARAAHANRWGSVIHII